MLKFKIATSRTHFPGLQVAVPIGAPFAVIRGGSYVNREGKVYTIETSYVWVDDLDLVRNHTRFTVHIARHGASMPFDKTVCANSGWARVLREFVRTLPANHTITRRLLKKDVLASAPRDRQVGAYIQRGRPGYDTNPHITTETSVVAGVRYGRRWYSEEGYNYIRYDSSVTPYI